MFASTKGLRRILGLYTRTIVTYQILRFARALQQLLFLESSSNRIGRICLVDLKSGNKKILVNVGGEPENP